MNEKRDWFREAYNRQLELQRQVAALNGHLEIERTVLDIRKLTGWGETKARSHLVQWMKQRITFDEMTAALKMGEEPQPAFSGNPLKS